MGVITDYFAAASDEAAVGAFDYLGGPAQPRVGAPAFDTLPAKGVDPVVNLGMLESIITGRSWREIFDKPEHGTVLVHDGDESYRTVITVSEELRALLSVAAPGQLAEWVVPWSQTEEFRGASPGALVPFLGELAELARRASARGERLYCLMSV